MKGGYSSDQGAKGGGRTLNKNLYQNGRDRIHAKNVGITNAAHIKSLLREGRALQSLLNWTLHKINLTMCPKNVTPAPFLTG